jgi:hypothetical protein
VQEALYGGPLPFVADPVQSPTPATRFVVSLLSDIDEPIEDLARADIAAAIADALRSLSGQHDRRPARIDIRAVALARDSWGAETRSRLVGVGFPEAVASVLRLWRPPLLVSLLHLVFCRLLAFLLLLARGDRSKELEILVLRHELAILRR